MIPFPLNGTKHHQRHHERVRGNYAGPLAIWDFICSTRIPESHFHQQELERKTQIGELDHITQPIGIPEQAS